MEKKALALKDENIKNDIKDTTSTKPAINKEKKCGKCKKTQSYLVFMRNDKEYKTCNKCDEKGKSGIEIKESKKEIKKIVKDLGLNNVNLQPDIEIKNLMTTETNNDIKLIKIENSATELEKQMDIKLAQTPLEKINALEKLCGLSLTQPDDYTKKTDGDKVEYQKILITKMTKLYENKMNPLSWLLLMGANVVEKNAHFMSYAGVEVDLTGYQKELYDHKSDLDAVCLEIMTETPEMLQYINNPYVKLSLIMTQCGMNVALQNAAKKPEATGSNPNNNNLS